MEIRDIYRVQYMEHGYAYAGTLRNEKKFNINDIVFVGVKNTIMKCRVIGVELELDQNPNYIYKLHIPKDAVNDDSEVETMKITCSTIFSSLEDAKKSAIQNLQRMAKLQLSEINSFFKQFEHLKK